MYIDVSKLLYIYTMLVILTIITVKAFKIEITWQTKKCKNLENIAYEYYSFKLQILYS